jgi:hypothetical protein
LQRAAPTPVSYLRRLGVDGRDEPGHDERDSVFSVSYHVLGTIPCQKP